MLSLDMYVLKLIIKYYSLDEFVLHVQIRDLMECNCLVEIRSHSVVNMDNILAV